MATTKRSSRRSVRTAKPKRAVRRRPGPRKPSKAAAARRPEAGGPAPLRLRSVTPTFTVNDLDRTIGWYCDGLGFAVSERWEEGGRLAGVMLRAGDCTLAFSQDDFAKGRDRPKGIGFRIYLTTNQSVDALADRIRGYGGKITKEPTEVPWAKRSFALEDPDGFQLTIDEARR